MKNKEFRTEIEIQFNSLNQQYVNNKLRLCPYCKQLLVIYCFTDINKEITVCCNQDRCFNKAKKKQQIYLKTKIT